MDLKKAIDILELHNKWRRDNTGEVPFIEPKLIGEAIDLVVDEYKSGDEMSTCDICGCHPSMLYVSEFGRHCVRCKPE